MVLAMASIPRRILSKARRAAMKVRPAADTPYATHTPILMGIGRSQKIRKVLELGSGPYSTAIFLDREVFPDLESLVSYEDDPEWLPVVQAAVGDDPRLDLRMVNAVRESVPDDISDFDLIFIDDSRSPAERSQTIASVREKHPRAIVAIHDYEQRPYRAAARGFDQRHVVGTFTPQVGVCYNNSANVDEDALFLALRRIESSATLAPHLRDEWLEVLTRESARS
jgi:predicted O-methyltransferase YrrM